METKMYAVIGLGNPDKKYQNTRHNVGFDVIDELAEQMGVPVSTKRHRSLCGIGNIGGEKVVLVKPQTYMNNSGEALRRIIDFYKLDPVKDIIVISDDINLETGRIRIRAKGSAGGHNGLKSIISHAGTQDFTRVRVGVGQSQGNLIKHVLGKFSKKEREQMEDAIIDASGAVKTIITENVDVAMNKYNSRGE